MSDQGVGARSEGGVYQFSSSVTIAIAFRAQLPEQYHSPERGSDLNGRPSSYHTFTEICNSVRC